MKMEKLSYVYIVQGKLLTQHGSGALASLELTNQFGLIVTEIPLIFASEYWD